MAPPPSSNGAAGACADKPAQTRVSAPQVHGAVTPGLCSFAVAGAADAGAFSRRELSRPGSGMKHLSIRKLAAVLVVLAAMFGAYPASYLGCPNWEVTVVDESGRPLPGMTVRRSCNDYSAGIHRDEDRVTDERGKAAFEAQQFRSAILGRWLRNVGNALAGGVHASFGRNSYVFAFGRGRQGSPVRKGSVEFWHGSPERMESRIVARPVAGLEK